MPTLRRLPVGNDVTTLYPSISVHDIYYVVNDTQYTIKQAVQRTEFDDGFIKQKVIGKPTYRSTGVVINCRTTAARDAMINFFGFYTGYGAYPFFMTYDGKTIQARLTNGMNSVKVKNLQTQAISLYQFEFDIEWIDADL